MFAAAPMRKSCEYDTCQESGMAGTVLENSMQPSSCRNAGSCVHASASYHVEERRHDVAIRIGLVHFRDVQVPLGAKRL
jgi:hypothetical protein